MDSLMKSKKIFEVPITLGRYKQYVKESLEAKVGYSCFLNSHMLWEYHNKQQFKRVLKEAKYILPDGMPATYSARLFGSKKQDRIAGNDVIFTLIEYAKVQNLKVFVIGATEEVLSKVSVKLEREHVEHQTFSPPFLPIEEFDFENQAKIINNYQPNMVLVGLGCPKQEIWMYKMRNKISAPMYGLGGALLLYAEIDSRAPLWMRKLALEWIYRLALEPKRLFRRYLVTNTYFCYLFIKELVKKIFK